MSSPVQDEYFQQRIHMIKYTSFMCVAVSLLTIHNSCAMENRVTAMSLWTPQSQKPALYLNLSNGKFEDTQGQIVGLSRYGESEILDLHFPDDISKRKGQVLPMVLGSNPATIALLKTALVFAQTNGRAKVEFEHILFAHNRKGKFVASFIYVDPDQFQVTITECKAKKSRNNEF